jgi:carboxypeptidase Taq
MSNAYEELSDRLREAAAMESAARLLGWDQETMMPQRAADSRAEELALLGRLVHERVTDPRIGELIDTCESDDELTQDPRIAANLRELRRDFERARRLPTDLVAELQALTSRALQAWKTAREQSDFASFEPWLVKLLDLTRRKAECLGAPDGGELYDALLDEYEPGVTARQLESIFEPLRAAITPLIAETTSSPTPPEGTVREIAFPLGDQQRLNAIVLKQLGFDSKAGRFDVSVHPFSTGISPGDTRITTRYSEKDFTEALGSTMHEAGHGLYEQGLPTAEHWGQPLGQSMGLGIHESQSRLWENHVGRSLPFWKWVTPHAKRILGARLDPFTSEQFYRAVNIVRPHLIRVESDEATYNLHIMLRFDLERALLRGDLSTADLPAAWNERIRKDLGLEVPDDARGCLQDIHWAMGAIGYFPTYTLGTLYAAQLWEAVLRDVPDVETAVSEGRFEPLLAWLRDRIHRHGRRYTAEELCTEVCGQPLDHRPLVLHLRDKLGAIYRLNGQASVS